MKAITPIRRVVVLKSNRLHGDLISRQIKMVWRSAYVEVFQRGFDALKAIHTRAPDLFITGVRVEDMNGLEHLLPFVERELPILIVTSRKDAHTFNLLREVRYGGIFDAWAEGLENLYLAIDEVMDDQLYISSSVVPHIRKPEIPPWFALTAVEARVLSVIGDGSDDSRAAERLGLSSDIVSTHRQSIMAKLGLRDKGEVMLYALRHGYVPLMPIQSQRPGFQQSA
jgi:DNA-binding NarL/FixJ family response regulator